MHNYTQLLISGNDKNKQLTLLSQRKLALTGRNMLMALLNSEGHLKKIKKPGGTLKKIQAYIFLFMSSMPNAARVTVFFRIKSTRLMGTKQNCRNRTPQAFLG
jgi:hypothetical protein